ncbi:MAG: hypothetical protein JNK60_10700 [Acidobacteria bacterium]|nr:hypothetical protein [Acidobacteriota bacterium]
MTLDEFERQLVDPDPEVRAYFTGKLMRQAKPDDVFTFVKLATIRELWPSLERYLGDKRPFWTWLLERWSDAG